MATTGDTPTSLARKAGVAQSTLTRFLNSDDSAMISLRSVAKIAHAAKVEPPSIVAFAAPSQSRLGADAAPFSNHPTLPDAIGRAVQALVGNSPATDPWLLQSTALTCAGCLPGDILIVDLNGSAEPGDIVCAQVYRWQDVRAVTVFRIFEPPYLIAASAEAEHRRPFLVDNDRVIIKGVVRAVVRATKRTAAVEGLAAAE